MFLVAKVGRIIRLLKQFYYLVALVKLKYFLISKGIIYLEPLRVEGLPVLRPKLIVRWLGF